MDKTKPKHTYIFVNPNGPDAVAHAIRQILLEKLLSLPVNSGMAASK